MINQMIMMKKVKACFKMIMINNETYILSSKQSSLRTNKIKTNNKTTKYYQIPKSNQLIINLI